MEKRILDRFNLYYYLKVEDAETGKVLGHMVDINVKGIRILGKEAAEIDKTYTLKMELPTPIHGQQELKFQGTCRRSHPSENPQLLSTGFEIDEIDTGTIFIIESLIHRFLMNN